MRVLAIGLGGAGCRIAAALYANDRKSSKVNCVQALAVDIDHDTIAQLTALPESSKLCFNSLENGLQVEGSTKPLSSKIDISEIVSRIQNLVNENTDAILICCGLGGSMTDIAPSLITALRASVSEPLFGLVTLPCLSEGERRSAKAADDIEAIAPLVDGTILFDNETWERKVAGKRDAYVREMSQGGGFLGFGKTPPKYTPEEITYKLLNLSIIRRITLILRAGEFRADGGIDLAEVVMDSSEVLNTMMGMGFITIGYAVEYLPQNAMSFLSWIRPSNETEEQRKSAERIIDLAKKAIYQEVSIPCDMTSASKALILVAGPSHEISMKGFMTVRKWIDRSIAGMETRSGDYPISNNKYVAIIVMLSGLQNIPRITELKQIRDQLRYGISRELSATISPDGSIPTEIVAAQEGQILRDEMISLSGEGQKKRRIESLQPEDTIQYTETPVKPVRAPQPVVTPEPEAPAIRRRPGVPKEEPVAEPQIPAPVYPESPPEPVVIPKKPPAKSADTIVREAPIRRQTIPVTKSAEPIHRPQERVPPAGLSPKRETSPLARRPLESGYEAIPPMKRIPATTRERDHQNIERVLKRQQVMIKTKSPEERETVKRPEPAQKPEPHETKPVSRRVVSKATVQRTVPPAEPETPTQVPEERTVIRVRKKVIKKEEYEPDDDPEYRPSPARQEELEPAAEPEEFIPPPLPKRPKAGDKDRLQPVRDDIFQGKSISQKEPLRVNDSALLHTDIKTKKGRSEQDTEESLTETENNTASKKKKAGKSSAQDDKISWIND